MTDPNNQDLSDKSISEFEKELEEVVRGVEIQETTNKTSCDLTANDDHEEVLKIEVNNITQLMEEVNNFQSDPHTEKSIEKVNDISSPQNLENTVLTEIIQEKVNENGTISELETNVNIEIKQTSQDSANKSVLEEHEEHKATFVENQTSPIVTQSNDNPDPSMPLEVSGKESSSVPETIEDPIGASEPSSENNVIINELRASHEESLTIEEIENEQTVGTITVIDSTENDDLQEENKKQELKEEAVRGVFHDDSTEVVIVKSFLDTSTDSELNVEHSQSEIVIINDSGIITGSEENTETIAAVTEAQTLDEQQVVQLDYLEDDLILQEKGDNNTLVENEESRNIITEIDGNKKIPCHVLGRNVVNPSVDVAGKGRIPPKPRLGVKIPYRNLTSQIVSKDEIAEEIMERSRQRNASLPSSKDILFARKLTQRLASKLAAAESSTLKKESPSTSVKKESNEKNAKTENPSGTSPEKKSSSSNNCKKEKISDNSDLLAILEGDDEMDWPETDSNKVTPTKSSKTCIQGKNNTQEHLQKKEQQNENKSESASNGSNMESDDFITEPKFSSSLVTKTYTRKRKSSGDTAPANTISKKSVVPEEKLSAEPKVNIDLAPNTYISKSSRIVKKKVIWDPDEAIPMSTFAISKPKIETKQVTPVKTGEKKIIKAEKPTTTTVACVKMSEKKLSPQGKVHQVSEEKLTKKTPKITTNKSPTKKIDTHIDKQADGKASVVKEAPEKVQPKKSLSPIKKSPFKSKQHNQAHKRRYLSEVDKLLMDEGALNMLYAVKNTEESESPSNKVKGKKKNDVFSIDNFHQELLDKTNEIKNDLQMNSSKESPKSLRKKDNSIPILKRSEVVGPTGIPLARKKSKDSIRNSTQSPPSSPAYTYTAEASRIIRRHSSSSFSSVGSHAENVNDENKSVNGAPTSSEKSSKTVKHKVPITVDGTKSKKIKLTKDHTNLRKQKQKRTDKITSMENDEKQEQQNSSALTDGEFDAITLKRFDDIVQIVFSSPSDHLCEMILSELSTVLTKLGEDETCSTVVLSSSGNCFSQGINYNLLVENNENQRKNIAEKLAFSVKDFLKSVAIFPKLLIAGVNGDAVGLAVTMLPLFDMVLASDSAAFSAPYASLGCTLEGGILLSYLPNAMHNTLISELFFASRNLSSSDALKFGLVTRTLCPDKFQDELISTLKTISRQSLQGVTSIKKSLRHQLLTNIDSLLKIETDTLVELWTSEECQNKFKESLGKNE